MPPTIADVAALLARFAPPALAEDWDNVGLLVGDPARPAGRIMTCLTVTPDSLAEAIGEKADLIVAHHPLPFRPVRRLTTTSHDGRLLLELAANRIALYSPHTGFDSAREGINQQLAEGLGLTDIRPLRPGESAADEGVGRMGRIADRTTASQFADTVGKFLGIERMQIVGSPGRTIETVAVGCGSAGDLLPLAIEQRCDAFVTGEARFHTALEAEAANLVLILAGHFATERFAVERLADRLTLEFPAAQIWPSARERDPLKWHDSSHTGPKRQ